MRFLLALCLLLPTVALAGEVPELAPLVAPGTTIAAWEQQRAEILRGFEQVAGPLPRPENPVLLDPQVLEEAVLEDGIIRQKISYHTDSPTERQSAYLMIPPTKPGEKRPAVIVFHSTQSAGKKQPVGLAGKRSRHIALHLTRRGFVTISPDYPSFGEFKHDFAHDGYESGVMLAIFSNIRAIDLLCEQPEVDDARIGAIGHSLGGHTAIFTALYDPRIKAIVSNCGFTRFHRYYEGDLTGWTSPRYFPKIATVYDKDPDQVPFDFPGLIAALAPRPFLASAPIHDDNFAVQGVRESIAAARSVYKLYGASDNLRANYPNCDHDFPPKAREVAYSFLEKHLGPVVDDQMK